MIVGPHPVLDLMSPACQMMLKFQTDRMMLAKVQLKFQADYVMCDARKETEHDTEPESEEDPTMQPPKRLRRSQPPGF